MNARADELIRSEKRGGDMVVRAVGQAGTSPSSSSKQKVPVDRRLLIFYV